MVAVTCLPPALKLPRIVQRARVNPVTKEMDITAK